MTDRRDWKHFLPATCWRTVKTHFINCVQPRIFFGILPAKNWTATWWQFICQRKMATSWCLLFSSNEGVKKSMDFFLNRTEISKFSKSDKSLMHEFNYPVRHTCISILVSSTERGRFKPFYCNGKYFLSLNSANSMKKFRKNSTRGSRISQK